MCDGFEDREIQPFVPDGAIESFHISVLCGLAGLYKPQLDSLGFSPLPEFLADVLGSIIQA